MAIDGLERVDLRALIESTSNVQFKQGKSAGTISGPCPKCGGVNRLRVIVRTENSGPQKWICNQCMPPNGRHWHTAIDWLVMVCGMRFDKSASAADKRAVFDVLKQFGFPSSDSFCRSTNVPRSGTKRTEPVYTPEGVEMVETWPEPPTADGWQRHATAHVLECCKRLWSPAGREALRYLRESRKLTDETIERFALGFCDRDDRDAGTWRGITIPIYYAGAIWAVKTRRSSRDLKPRADGKEPPKYLDMTGGAAGKVPFNGDPLLVDDDISCVIVCEGEFDAMVAQQHAPAGAICATWGSAVNDPTHEAVILLRGRRVLLAFDADEAGSAAAVAWERLGRRVDLPAGKDITEFAQQGGDVGAWLRTVLGDDSDQWDEAVLEALRRAGWSASFKHDAGFTAIREVTA